MEIKGPGRPSPPPPPGENRIEQRPAGKFPAAGSKAPEQAVHSAPAGGAASVRSEFRKADLGDAAKADRMVRLSAEDLVKTHPGAASLSPAQRQQVADWIQQDPVMRGKILKHLERILD